MAHSPRMNCWTLLVTIFVILICSTTTTGLLSSVHPKHHSRARLPPSSSSTSLSSCPDIPNQSRCQLFQSAAAMVSTASVVLMLFQPAPAYAVKERNEALCGTGFFTNIAQYMCTEVGNISDEGSSRKMNDQELSSTESLLNKLSTSSVFSTSTTGKEDEVSEKYGSSKDQSLQDET